MLVHNCYTYLILLRYPPDVTSSLCPWIYFPSPLKQKRVNTNCTNDPAQKCTILGFYDIISSSILGGRVKNLVHFGRSPDPFYFGPDPFLATPHGLLRSGSSQKKLNQFNSVVHGVYEKSLFEQCLYSLVMNYWIAARIISLFRLRFGFSKKPWIWSDSY